VTLKGRLGLEAARIPHKDRHGLMWLARGRLVVEDGTLRFITAGYREMEAGAYAIPYQQVSCIVLEPGTTVSHDALRLLARHGVGLVATGEAGVRFYASMPFGPDESARARRQVRLWADRDRRSLVARRMYAMRMGEVFPAAQIEVLRGLEGARAKKMYAMLAQQHGIKWRGRRYDRHDPTSADQPNQAINHVAVSVIAAAQVATAACGAIPQLGFIHESSGIAFCLDIADLFRDDVTVTTAFAACKSFDPSRRSTFERHVRKQAGEALRRGEVVSKMIDRAKKLLDEGQAET
jgi:CRISPR-associated protein Cas1